MKNNRLPYLITLAIIMTLSACSSTENESDANENLDLVTAYLGVKDALVKTDASLAAEAASKMAEQLGDSQNEILAKLKSDALEIAKSDDMEQQRNSFNKLSQTMYNYVKQNNDENLRLYKQFCPMAFNDTGAFWLASEKEINNPYFGNKMLKCGVVKEIL